MRLPIAVLLALALAPAAHAADRWRGLSATRIPLPWYQGVAADPDHRLFFDGVFVGLHRADDSLRQRASVDNAIPPAVTAREGYNHIGDITWDARDDGRLLLPLECYYPGTTPDPNTCHTGSIGVADPGSLRWKYYVKLRPAEIPKAMWAEVSPDGRLLWTSAGPDLLAYRVATSIATTPHPAALRCGPCAACAAPCLRRGSPAPRSTATGSCSPASATRRSRSGRSTSRAATGGSRSGAASSASPRASRSRR